MARYRNKISGHEQNFTTEEFKALKPEIRNKYVKIADAPTPPEVTAQQGQKEEVETGAGEPAEEATDDKERDTLLARYEELFGKEAPSNIKLETLRKKIGEAEDNE